MELRQIPNPYGTPWRMWVDVLVGFNRALITNVSPDESWETVATRLTEYADLAPAPGMFATWQEWAVALKQAYPN